MAPLPDPSSAADDLEAALGWLTDELREDDVRTAIRRAAKVLRDPGRGGTRIVLPYYLLVSDNDRTKTIKVPGRGRVPKRTPKYLAAQRAIAATARTLFDDPLVAATVHFDFYVPDRRVRDLPNTFKQLFDALVGTAIDDDRWSVVPAGSWRVAAVDRDDPRVEIFIAPLDPSDVP